MFAFYVYSNFLQLDFPNVQLLMQTAEDLTQFFFSRSWLWAWKWLTDRKNIEEVPVRILPQWLDCPTEHSGEGYFKKDGNNNLSSRHSSYTESSSSVNTKIMLDWLRLPSFLFLFPALPWKKPIKQICDILNFSMLFFFTELLCRT